MIKDDIIGEQLRSLDDAMNSFHKTLSNLDIKKMDEVNPGLREDILKRLRH